MNGRLLVVLHKTQFKESTGGSRECSASYVRLEASEVCWANLSTPQAEEGDPSSSSGQQMVGPEEHRFWSPFPGPIDEDLGTGQMPNKANKSQLIFWDLSNCSHPTHLMSQLAPIPTSQLHRFQKQSRRRHADPARQIDSGRSMYVTTLG